MSVVEFDPISLIVSMKSALFFLHMSHIIIWLVVPLCRIFGIVVDICWIVFVVCSVL